MICFVAILLTCALENVARSTAAQISGAYGNELINAEHFFDATEFQFNKTNFFAQLDSCWQRVDPYLCFSRVNSMWQPVARIWDPLPIEPNHPRMVIDCRYEISSVEVLFEIKSNEVTYSFRIGQGSCAHNIGISGGTTFEVVFYNAFFLLSCVTIDHKNGEYSIFCSIACNDHPSYCNAGHVPLCGELTVVLYFEHFDVYSEVVSQGESRFKENTYYPSRHVLQDNVTYCFEVVTHKDVKLVKYSLENIHAWFSGKWLAGDTSGTNHPINRHLRGLNATKRLLSLSHTVLHTPTEEVLVQAEGEDDVYVVIDGQRMHIPDMDTLLGLGYSIYNVNMITKEELLAIPIKPPCGITANVHQDSSVDDPTAATSSDWSLLRSRSFMTATQFHLLSGESMTNFTPVYRGDEATLPKTAIADPSLTTDRYVFRPIIVTKERDSRPFTRESVTTFPNIIPTCDDKLEIDATTQYHLIGASHMRYNFDALIRYFVPEAAASWDRKHGSIKYKNFHFHYTTEVEELNGILNNLCTNTGKLAVVMQAADWDLTRTSPRRVLENPDGLRGLLRTVGAILNGDLACPGMEHIVWMTTVPYPVCFDDLQNPNCNKVGGYRHNPAIAAINELALGQLTAMHSSNKVKVSVIDAFSIIRPRLLFNEKAEVVCTVHYLCGMTLNETEAHAVHTPGGNAVLQMLLVAMTYL